MSHAPVYITHRRWWLLPLLLWGGLVGVSMQDHLASEEQQALDIASEGARHMFQMIVLTRAWNASHGGVYVPVGGKIQPNPYLEHPRRDLTSTDGQRLTMVNPAFMTRLIAELAQREKGAAFHITSLKPIRPGNAPDAWETRALAAFDQGREEVVEVVEGPQETGRLLRYMAPLKVQASCLDCHAKQGYQIGEVRGGISVSLAYDAIAAAVSASRLSIVITHLTVFLLVGALGGGFLELLRRRWRRLDETVERLHISEARYRELFESSNDALMLLDENGFIDGNAAALRMFGLPDAAALRRYSPAELSPALQPDGESSEHAARRHIEHALEHGSAAFIWQHCRADPRQVFPAEVWLSPVRFADRRILQATVRDITERQRAADAVAAAEEQLRQRLQETLELNRKLEEAQNQLLQSEKMASIGQLAAGVAHELNNPIGFVYSNMGSLEGYLKDLFAIADAFGEAAKQVPEAQAPIAAALALMQEKDYAFLKEDIGQLMDESKDGLARVRKIVQDLKDFSRVGETEWQWSDLHAGLDSTLNIVWNELKYKCKVHKAYGDLPQIRCMPAQLNQVFMNLLVNAGHAINTQGDIYIRTGRDGEQVWVEIEDSGQGIPEENLNRIFEPFYTTKPVGKGTGLGLSLAYGIVAKHQGRIEVHSTVGQGTRFRVWLPIDASAATDASQDASEGA